jgi:hypothetical protein
MTDPNRPEPPDLNLPLEQGRTSDPGNHSHPPRAEDAEALIGAGIG